jgi:hypothetical protein
LSWDWLSVIGYLLSVISYRLSVIGYQLSAISYRLSVIGYQLSAISYRLSVIGYQLSALIKLILYPAAADKCDFTLFLSTWSTRKQQHHITNQNQSGQLLQLPLKGIPLKQLFTKRKTKARALNVEPRSTWPKRKQQHL